MPFTPDYFVPEERRAYTMLNGPVGCLMLHGFMGSPISSHPLAQYLSRRGISMHCPLLPGHGEFPRRFYRIPHEAWLAEADEALSFLRAHCDEIILMGHSMGTILGAELALQYDHVKGQVMIAPVYAVPDRRIHLMRFLRYIMPWFYPLKLKSLQDLVYQRVQEFDPEIDLDDPDVQARLPEMSKVPTSGIDEMRKVVDKGRRFWPRLDIPVLIFQGGEDFAAKPEFTGKLFEILPNPEKELILIPDGGHEVMRPFDPVHQQVWEKIYQFILTHTSLEKEGALQDVGIG